MTETAGDPAERYSRAFENIVQEPDDIVGLLAYSLYKESVREEARQGNRVDGLSRNPPPATVSAFRLAAEQRLTQMVSEGIEGARPDMLQSATISALDAVRSDILARVEERTGFGAAIWPNIAAWAITIVLTAILIFVMDRPDPSHVIAKAADHLQGAAAPR